MDKEHDKEGEPGDYKGDEHGDIEKGEHWDNKRDERGDDKEDLRGFTCEKALTDKEGFKVPRGYREQEGDKGPSLEWTNYCAWQAYYAQAALMQMGPTWRNAPAPAAPPPAPTKTSRSAGKKSRFNRGTPILNSPEEIQRWIEERKRRHPANSIREEAPLATTTMEAGELVEPEKPGSGKRRKCKYFAKGHCRRGDDCGFLHVPSLPRAIRPLTELLVEQAAGEAGGEIVLPSREEAERMRIAWRLLEELINA